MREDRDLRTYTRRGALGLMGAGGVFAATETFGFTELTADRGTDVQVASDNTDSVALQITDSDSDTIQDSYTIDESDGETETFSITNESNAAISSSDNDLSVELKETDTSTDSAGSATVNIDQTSGFDADTGTISTSSSETLHITSDSGPWTFTLSIDDTASSGSDDRDALKIDIIVTADLESTQIELTRTTTIQDQ